MENGDTEAGSEESWEQKAEPSEAEPGGDPAGDGGPPLAAPVEMEEEEEVSSPKVAVVEPGAPRKEHVNVVFIGHVGKLLDKM